MKNFSAINATLERRRKPRIYQPFQVIVSGIATDGEAFEIVTVLDNMSSTGIYLKLEKRVELGVKLSMMIRLSTSHDEDLEVAKVAIECIVVRSEPLTDGKWGVALSIIKRRFMR
jgi:hypothetical protein